MSPEVKVKLARLMPCGVTYHARDLGSLPLPLRLFTRGLIDYGYSAGLRDLVFVVRFCCRVLSHGPRHQHRKHDRDENERRHISHQMTALGWIVEGLNAHDHRVNHARPYGEPDEAPMIVGFS